MKKWLILLILIVGLFVLTVCLPNNFSSQRETLFSVVKGESSKDIAQNLEKDGIIWWCQFFRAYVLVRNTSDELQAGTYRVSPSMSILTIAEKFASGDVAKETVTIPEGFTSEQILQKLQSAQLAGSSSANLTALQEHEGYLFPDTYQIPYGWNVEKIIGMMTDNFERKLTPYQSEITKTGRTLSEIVKMASLIEKEVRTKEDKKIVSGIFWKRMKIGKPLESCATIAYIKKVNQWRYSYDDTRIESPYNTYLNIGLPPGPICNPGLESIEAALFPQESPYWYWLSTPEGKTIFSKTLEEHNIAKAKYLQ